MAYKVKGANGMVTLNVAESITGVVLEDTIQGDVKIRPTNTTAWICTDPDVDDLEDVDPTERFILLHNGPKGGFTQGGALATAAAQTFLVSQNVFAVITDA